MTHEFGHHVQFWLDAGGFGDKSFLPVVSADGFGVIRDTALIIDRTKSSATGVSQYSLKNRMERFAEAFTASYHGTAPKKHKLVKQMDFLIDKLRNSDKLYGPEQWRWLNDVSIEERQEAIKKINAMKGQLGL